VSFPKLLRDLWIPEWDMNLFIRKGDTNICFTGTSIIPLQSLSVYSHKYLPLRLNFASIFSFILFKLIGTLTRFQWRIFSDYLSCLIFSDQNNSSC
jgi:hypothetical protein